MSKGNSPSWRPIELCNIVLWLVTASWFSGGGQGFVECICKAKWQIKVLGIKTENNK